MDVLVKSGIIILFLLSSFWEEVISVGEHKHHIQVVDRMLKAEEEHDQRFNAYWSVRQLRSKKRGKRPPVAPPTSNTRVSWRAPPAYRYQSPPPPAPSQHMPSPPTLPHPPPGPRLL